MGIYFISHVGGHKYSANLMIYRRGEVAVRDEVDASDGNGNQQVSHEDTQDQIRSNRAVEIDGVDGSNGIRSSDGVQAGTLNGQMPSRGLDRETNGGEMGEGSQCIWLARVRPEDCEGIVKHTILKGKVIKPERQLRGGFDRQRGLVSW